MWMTDDLLIAVAKEEGWKPGTACAARDAAVWCNQHGITVVSGHPNNVLCVKGEPKEGK